MRILMPDVQFPGDAAIEAGVVGPGVALEVYRATPQSGIPDTAWRGADGLICYHEVVIDRAMVEWLERCRIIVRAGVGFDNIDLQACGTNGIPVCNVPDYGTTDVADHAMALMLTLLRGTAIFDAELRADPVGGWRVGTAPLIRRLREQRLGIVGLGRIGLATAMRAKAFGLDVVFYDPYQPTGYDLATGFRRAGSLDDLLAEIDILTLHTPLTPETRNMIDAKALASAKPGLILVNTARGPVVDLDALFEALQTGHVAGVALDVLPTEPASADHPLIRSWQAQEDWIKGRVLLSPHAAYFSSSSLADLRCKSAETAVAYLRAGRLANCVNRDFLVEPRRLDMVAGED